MTFFQAFFLGVVQGLTEFIPVSSTAHLLIASNLLGLLADDRTFSFNVIIQLGTVLAMLVFFWRDIWEIARAFLFGIFHKKPFENLNARLGWLVIVAVPWADVSVDGAPVKTVPLRRLALAPGPHVVRFVHPDYQPLQRTVTVRAGQALNLTVDLPEEAVRKGK